MLRHIQLPLDLAVSQIPYWPKPNSNVLDEYIHARFANQWPSWQKKRQDNTSPLRHFWDGFSLTFKKYKLPKQHMLLTADLKMNILDQEPMQAEAKIQPNYIITSLRKKSI